MNATPAGQPPGHRREKGEQSGVWTLGSGNKILSTRRKANRSEGSRPAFANWASAGTPASSFPSAQTTCPFPAHFTTLFLCSMSSFWVSVPLVCFDHLMTSP